MAPTPEGKQVFGEYNWQTYRETDEIAQKFAKGLMVMDLCPEIEGEGSLWRFLGIWAKNRKEWTTGLLSCMHYGITTVGFYDAMGFAQVDFILDQTEMKTILVSLDYAAKLIEMKKNGLAGYLDTVITIEEAPADMKELALQQNLNLHSFAHVCEMGEGGASPDFKEPAADDVHVFSYTSGTTGDAKGVKLSHKNLLSMTRCAVKRLEAG